MKKINALVYKSPVLGDCSNNGISAYYDKVVCYFLENNETVGSIENPEPNAVVFVPRMLWGEKHYYFQPVAKVPSNHIGYMASGVYVGSSDSRFIELTTGYEILPLHDRTESQQLYNSYFD